MSTFSQTLTAPSPPPLASNPAGTGDDGPHPRMSWQGVQRLSRQRVSQTLTFSLAPPLQSSRPSGLAAPRSVQDLLVICAVPSRPSAFFSYPLADG